MTDNTNKKSKIKLDDLNKQLEEFRKQNEEYKNDLIRLQADFENHVKRVNKEKEELVNVANGNLIKELLVIIDDFETALQQVENENNKEGLILLHKKFFKILESQGLRQIESLGKKFDPYIHEVIKLIDSDKEENEIVEEIQKGYFLHNHVVRPSKVIISNGKKENNVTKEVN